jgi:hypothetical protein
MQGRTAPLYVRFTGTLLTGVSAAVAIPPGVSPGQKFEVQVA